MKHLASYRASYLGAFAASALGLAAWAQPAAAQQVAFGTNFDNYQNGFTLTGQAGGTGTEWTSNDLYRGNYTGPNGTREIGESNGISTGYNATGSSNLQALLGGTFNRAGGALPGQATSYVYRPFGYGGAATLQFNVDFIVTASSNLVSGASATANKTDTFGFTFQGGGANLFGVNFTPTIDRTDLDSANITISSNTFGSDQQTPFGVQLGNRYRLTVNVTLTNSGGTFSAFTQGENSDGSFLAGTTPTALVSNAAFTGNIGQIAARWSLSDQTQDGATGAYTNGGTNTMAFDNYVVTVPEPSTWALLGAGTLLLAVAVRRRMALAA